MWFLCVPIKPEKFDNQEITFVWACDVMRCWFQRRFFGEFCKQALNQQTTVLSCTASHVNRDILWQPAIVQTKWKCVGSIVTARHQVFDTLCLLSLRNCATRYVSWNMAFWLSYWKQNHDFFERSVEIRQRKWTQQKYWCHLIGHVQFCISLPLQICLSCIISKILWCISQNVRCHVTLNTYLSEVIYHAHT